MSGHNERNPKDDAAGRSGWDMLWTFEGWVSPLVLPGYSKQCDDISRDCRGFELKTGLSNPREESFSGMAEGRYRKHEEANNMHHNADNVGLLAI